MKVLIVDDDEGIRRMCARVLSLAGHECSVCPDGASATPLLAEGDWDLVLSDLSLPGTVDGLEVLHRARASTRADVVLMTGHPDMESAVGALKEGAYDYVMKPFLPERLLSLAERVDERRRLHGELARERELRARLDEAYGKLRELESLRGVFGRFVTPEVAGDILADPGGMMRRGERREVSVLFADVRGFTPFAASVEPEEAVHRLNELLGAVIEEVQREGGIVNKFLGDGLMAVFGAPAARGDHAEAAARCALRARDRVDALTGRPRLRMGFGVNTGVVVAGCVGSEERAEYTVIGHAVNLAQRLESCAQEGQILIGEATGRVLLDTGGYRISPRLLRVQGIDRLVPAVELLHVREAAAAT